MVKVRTITKAEYKKEQAQMSREVKKLTHVEQR